MHRLRSDPLGEAIPCPSQRQPVMLYKITGHRALITTMTFEPAVSPKMYAFGEEAIQDSSISAAV